MPMNRINSTKTRGVLVIFPEVPKDLADQLCTSIPKQLSDMTWTAVSSCPAINDEHSRLLCDTDICVIGVCVTKLERQQCEKLGFNGVYIGCCNYSDSLFEMFSTDLPSGPWIQVDMNVTTGHFIIHATHLDDEYHDAGLNMEQRQHLAAFYPKINQTLTETVYKWLDIMNSSR